MAAEAHPGLSSTTLATCEIVLTAPVELQRLKVECLMLIEIPKPEIQPSLYIIDTDLRLRTW